MAYYADGSDFNSTQKPSPFRSFPLWAGHGVWVFLYVTLQFSTFSTTIKVNPANHKPNTTLKGMSGRIVPHRHPQTHTHTHTHTHKCSEKIRAVEEKRFTKKTMYHRGMLYCVCVRRVRKVERKTLHTKNIKVGGKWSYQALESKIIKLKVTSIANKHTTTRRQNSARHKKWQKRVNLTGKKQ